MIEIFTSSTLAQNLQPIIASSSLWKDKDLHVIIIANPHSGGFTQPKTAMSNLKILQEESAKIKDEQPQVKTIEMRTYDTKYPSHSMEFVESTFMDMLPLLKDTEKTNHRVLFVTAGGDGTSLEVQTKLLELSRTSDDYRKIIQKCYCVLRLPFGTGNDGSDGRTIEETLLRLSKPRGIELQKAVEVVVEGEKKGTYGKWQKSKKENVFPPWYSFNIASIGIDAFITHMTNKMKDKFPGDFYQIWVDLACLFYNLSYKPGHAKIEMFKNGEKVGYYEGGIEFALLGASGHRTYGSNHKILPSDNDSVCITPRMSLFKKLSTKSSFNDGSHYGKAYSKFFDADKMVINYDENILVQVDGEAHLLQKENFPIVIKHTEPVIPVITVQDDPINHGTVKID
ncbi:MAG: diacylglycerol kinase family protein [Treponemataceae bacterium]|nr:diacylglycerol kinase family protein [Spirochaetales bacterium]MDY6031826.1 diacylglycerol kinase family protein [Treponemataceae bacterium]